MPGQEILAGVSVFNLSFQIHIYLASVFDLLSWSSECLPEFSMSSIALSMPRFDFKKGVVLSACEIFMLYIYDVLFSFQLYLLSFVLEELGFPRKGNLVLFFSLKIEWFWLMAIIKDAWLDIGINLSTHCRKLCLYLKFFFSNNSKKILFKSIKRFFLKSRNKMAPLDWNFSE